MTCKKKDNGGDDRVTLQEISPKPTNKRAHATNAHIFNVVIGDIKKHQNCTPSEGPWKEVGKGKTDAQLQLLEKGDVTQKKTQ